MSSKLGPPVRRRAARSPAKSRLPVAALGAGRRAREEHAEEVGEPGITGSRRPELVADVARLAGLPARAAEPGEARERAAGTERVGAAPARALELVPVGTEGVVLLALLGVREDRVRLVHVLEPLLGGLVARVAVGMVLAGELPEGLLDVGLGRGPRDAEDLVVIAVFHDCAPL